MTPSTADGLPPESFFSEYGTALTNGTAAVFAGAGLSRAAGFVDWAGLLQDFAEELKLDLKIETDLVSVAQYHVNAQGGARNRLEQKITNELAGSADLTASHQTLAELPIDLYWTTNYDDLLERALRDAGKRPQVKSAGSSLTVTLPESDAAVHKLHGDLSDPGNIVITRDDYEEYVDKHRGYREKLQSDLASRTFLFLGFSFTDPHLAFVLSEVRRMHRTSARTHYAVMRRESRSSYDDQPTFEYALNRQQIRVSDLKRYGIQTVLVDEYSEVSDLLASLKARYLRRQVFVSGALTEFGPAGQTWVEAFGQGFGRRLMQEGYNLVTGFGLGVGSPLLFGALQTLYESSNPRIDRRLLLRPFPQVAENADLAAVNTEYRKSMMTLVGFAVFIGGNRPKSGEGVEVSPGVIEEFQIAAANAAYPLPIGASGWAAQEIWNVVNGDMDRYFPTVKPPAEAWAVLNDEAATPDEAIAALFQIMAALRPS